MVDAPGPWRGWTPALRVSVVGLFLLAVVYAISLARPVLLPLIVAGLLALVLAPMVSVLEWMRLPRWLGSAITVAGFVALVGFGGYRVAGPAMEWVRDLPVLLTQARDELERIRSPVEEVSEAASRVEELTGGYGCFRT